MPSLKTQERRGAAGQRLRGVCKRFLENKVLVAQSAAGREAPLRPAGGLGGGGGCCKPLSRVWGSALEILKILKI